MGPPAWAAPGPGAGAFDVADVLAAVEQRPAGRPPIRRRLQLVAVAQVEDRSSRRGRGLGFGQVERVCVTRTGVMVLVLVDGRVSCSGVVCRWWDGVTGSGVMD